MLTSSLANTSVIVKFKRMMKFLIEIVNSPCHSLLATFIEFILEKNSKKASSCSKTSVHPTRTLNHSFELLFPFPLLIIPKKNCWRERGKESPMEGPEGSVEENDVCKTESVTEADVQEKDLDVSGGVDEFGVAGYESQGFTLSEDLR